MNSTLRLIPFAVVTAGLLSLTGCGSSPTVDEDDDSAEEDDAANEERDGGDDSDDRAGGGSRSDDDEEFVDDDREDCEPTTCAEQGADCGAIADGCGEVLDCGECADGELCGVVERNVCTAPEEICKPLGESDACAGKECGTAGDGCGGSYDCGSCADGQSCGLDEPFQCAAGSSSGECAARIDSCDEVGAECGSIGDGCGGTLDCTAETGGCADGTFCGLNGANKCGALPVCEPLDPDTACDGKCGFISNGCGEEIDGGLIQCSGCSDGLSCGANGAANVCGSTQDACEPAAQATACGSRECGAVSDGCDGSYVCGTCDSGEICRNGSCGAVCTPTPQAEACGDYECGFVSDGCGGSYDCGSCEGGEVCGLLAAFQCDAGAPTECIPLTPDAACEDRECGMVFDGCGAEADNLIDCTALLGDCPNGEYCGVVTAFQCDPPPGAPTCEPTTCAALGWECGMALDDCGNVYDCDDEGRSCDAATESCIGGINGPTTCVSGGPGGGGGADCDVCDAIPNCNGQSQSTRLTGRVITPGRSDNNTANQVGVPNAFVYILQTADASSLPALDAGIPSGGFACDRCAEQDLGPVLASDTTDALGNFTIDGNVPVGTPFVLVVKIGKFRRAVMYEVDSGDACQTVNIDELDTRLPRDMDDGLGANLPKVAVSTGQLDAMECVFEKMGVDSDEFARPGNDGGNPERFHLYRANGASDQDGNSTADSQLYGSLDRMMTYDMVVFDCEGSGYSHHDASDPNIREYVNRGGRLFASHLSFTWLCDNGSAAYDSGDPVATGLSGAATFPTCDTSNGAGDNSGTGIVSEGRPNANDTKIQKFISWLDEEAASFDPDDNTMSIIEPRDLATAVGSDSEEFIYRDLGSTESIQQFSFNTPYGAPDDEICGRVAYSGFHVSVGTTTNEDFPDHCSGDLTDQEKVLLYMLFDLGACVTTGEPEPPGCTPVDDCTGRCGNLPDGCGGVISCSCPDGVTCQSGGICGVPECVPATCADEGATCGVIADGCGGIVNCNSCPDGQVCGLVTPNQCTITCTPNSADDACEDKCGFVSDGCGGVHECPGCDGSLSCINGVCSDQNCDPQACPSELECGAVSDGCEGVVSCGTCMPPEVCGGAGEPNVCGVPDCPALECSDLNAQCGWIGDGCGGSVNCGACPAGQVCQGNTCTGCQPRSCADADAECGAIGDGCGNIVQCGDCPSGQVCGVQEANQCGPPGECSPLTCNQAGAECGLIGDGCGGTVDCGKCPIGKVCGIDDAFQCGDPPPCVSDTCEDVGAECGAIANGCGGLVDCGPCGPGETCGLITPNRCDSTGTAK